MAWPTNAPPPGRNPRTAQSKAMLIGHRRSGGRTLWKSINPCSVMGPCQPTWPSGRPSASWPRCHRCRRWRSSRHPCPYRRHYLARAQNRR
jgi:hypothetical protein